MHILVMNAGSSSLKISLVQDGRLTESRTEPPEQPIAGVDAVGHRFVHGGRRFGQAVTVDPDVESQLRDLTDLAPLHQPKALAELRAARELYPDVPHVACFDTAFHRSIPEAASTYALPAQWRAEGLRRYGFHGLSHHWVSGRVQALIPVARRVVSCHLGAGASLAAVLDGVSIDTTMGFTPLEGLVMATRSGSVDPGLLLWLIEHRGVKPAELQEALEHRSGLLALAGTADMRELLARRDAEAALALGVYLHRLVAGICAMAGALGGLDVLVFTGGVGEKAAVIRARTASALAFLGVGIDEELNANAAPDAEVTAAGAAVRTLVLQSREDLQIAQEVTDLLGG